MNLGVEDEFTEFKESLSQLDNGLISLTGMLNKHEEGTVYFGVADNGDVCGMDMGKNTLMDIRNLIYDRIKPSIYAEIKNYTDENGRNYIKVTAKGSDTPYSYDGRYYVRNVSADEQATNEILRKMLASSDTDIIRQKASLIKNLTFKSFSAILSSLGIHYNDSDEFYNNYGLLNREHEFNINAYLMSDNNNVSIKVVVFAGKDKTAMSERKDYGKKCLLLSLFEVLEYFTAINTTRVDVTGIHRIEDTLLDFPSFREAWINACLHNDWNEEMSPSVYMFDDRIEIVSYGGLPYSLSKEGFFRGTSVPVNKSLLMIFIALKYAEQSGHGVPTIVEKYGRDVFSFEDGMLKVTIPLSYERADVLERKNAFTHKKILSKNQVKVLKYLRDNSTATLREVATACGLSLAGVKKMCLKLQETENLVREGSKRDGYWIVT